ncbi:hypothetical protein [Isoptericola sp. BMS4]|uniref:hypothetical protein n=1 Tax=Isoptericola sp. BMS4 TaxID=2527875 RepID=UPI001420A3D5|nr:hypothetical protein [Isoptericola sp. BMS4]
MKKRSFVASALAAVLTVGVVAAPAVAGSGSTSDSDGDRSATMTVTTPKYVTIQRDGYTKIPVTATLSFPDGGRFTGWWAGDAGWATAESINGPWQYTYADFTNTVAKTKKVTLTFRKYDHLVPQRLAVGAQLAPEVSGSWLYPSKDHLTTVYLRNKRTVVGENAYRKAGSRAYVRIRGTVKENVWTSSWSDTGTWKGKKGVRVTIRFNPTGPKTWRTVKHVTTGAGGKVATRVKSSKAGTYQIVVPATTRTTGASGKDGVSAR